MVSRFAFAAVVLLLAQCFTTPAQAQNACANSVQGRIAWNREGSTAWPPANLTRLCAGQENSIEPGRCYAEVMSDRVSFGSGRRWVPTNALSLCAGAPNAKARLGCFSREIDKGTTWQDAISKCAPVVANTTSGAVNASGVTAQVKPAVVPTTPLNTAPAPDAARQARTQAATFTCHGPLKFSMNRVPTRDRPLEYDFKVEFVGATSARDVKPGQCWRSGGWDFGRSLNSQGQGWLMYRVDLRTCPFFENFTVENGRFTDMRVNDTYFGGYWFQQAMNMAPMQAVEAKWSGTDSGGGDQPVIYVVDAPDHHQPRRPGCG
jgi:hypothetical protein